MSIQNTNTINRYVGNGSTTSFTYNFKINDQSHIEVSLDNVVQTSGFTVTGVGNANGGTVNFATAPANGVKVVLRRNVPYTQLIDYITGDKFPADTHEAALDQLTMAAQQLQEQVDRSLHYPVTATQSAELPNPNDPNNQGKVLRLTSTGIDLVAVQPTDFANPLTTKGDLITRDSSTQVRLPVGSNNQILTPDSNQASGLKWANLLAHLDTVLGGTAASGDMLEHDGSTWIRQPDPRFLTPGMVYRGSLAASVSGNALTVALKTLDGQDPSSAKPVWITFRSTSGNGQVVVRKVTAPLSLTVSPGSTLGTVNNRIHRLYVYALDNNGTVELAIYNPWDNATNGLRGIVEALLQSTIAEGGGGGADNAHTLYSATARTNVAVAKVGYLESTQATAGTWASAPSIVQTAYPGMPKTGDIVQRIIDTTTVTFIGTAQIPLDNTIPQSNEGSQYQTVSITPLAGPNLIRVRHEALWSADTGTHYVFALFRGSEPDAIKATTVVINTNWEIHLVITDTHQAINTSSRAYQLRAGTGSSGTLRFNGDTGTVNGHVFGSAGEAVFEATEIWA
jgi:hypothetical protein